MLLPTPIQSYFDADSKGSVEALVQAFAPDAVVRDEGRTHSGGSAIGAWWRDTKARYQTVLEPFEATEVGKGAEVLAKVTGNFPGSPATLKFMFDIEGDRIERLEIGA